MNCKIGTVCVGLLGGEGRVNEGDYKFFKEVLTL
jgi:hypothetical protein